MSFSLAAARVFNALAAAAIAIYVVWRACVSKHAIRVWGLRRDNFWRSLRAQLCFAVPAAAALYGVGLFLGSVPLPVTFWLTLALYPLWGIAQQFALQNMIVNNLRALISHDVARAFVAALLFGLSHYPRALLVLLSFAAGFCFTLIYQRHRNLWAVGCVHGLLGAMAYYVVLQEDPGAKILDYVDGFQTALVP